MKKRAIVLASVTLGVVAIELVCGHWFAGRDLIRGLLGLEIVSIAGALALMSARLVAYLVLPGWALSVAVLAVFDRTRARREKK